MLKITNTLNKKEEEFKSIEPNKVKLYVCGVTPYDYAHLGHGRCYVTFDFLYRLLKFLGYKVTYCRNFTDVDDKLINKAEKELSDPYKYSQIAEKYIFSFKEDMEKLNCLSPDYEPRVTENIPEIIKFVEKLIESGHAYVSNGDVYFSVKSFSDYGKLSGRKLEDLKVGARIEINVLKRDPLDFALWKGEKEGTFWKSPWGYGRPGWHIECSVMANKYLGEHIDIHAGGMDLIFPHHENEIAQSESLFGPNFANYWIHNAFVQIDKQKMSKSLGNFFTLNEIFKKFDPMVIRYYFLKQSYRAPLDFTPESLEATKKSYEKLAKFFSKFECDDKLENEVIAKNEIVQKMLNFLLDDLNTSGALGVLFDNLDFLIEKDSFCEVKNFLQKVFGFTLKPLQEKEIKITPEIKRLIEEREIARQNKDWIAADKIREQLKKMGYESQDTKISE